MINIERSLNGRFTNPRLHNNISRDLLSSCLSRQMKKKKKKAGRRPTFLLKPPGKRYIFTKELELTELVFDEQTQGQVSLFEPVHDLTPTSQLLRDVGKEPVGCGSEMDIDV